MDDLLFGNNNTEVIKRLSKQYFKKNKVRNRVALLAIILTAFLFTSIISLAFNMASTVQLSLQMQKGSKADGTLGYMTEEQYEQLANSDFVEKAGHRRIIGYASNTSSHSIEINYADGVQQELTFCVPAHGAAPEKANEIATTNLALKALGVEPKVGAEVPLEFELRGKTYHYDMVLSGWWEASNDSVSVATVSEQFIKENPDVVKNTYATDHEMSGVTFSDVVLKNKANVQKQLKEFVYSVGGNPEDMSADNFILASENEMSRGLVSSDSVVFASVFILMFVVCGYLLIYNIFDISVMQDVRQYGLLRTIGTSTRQIKSIVNRQAVRLTLIGMPVGLAAGFFAGWMLLPVVTEIVNLEYSMVGTSVSTSPLIFVIAALFTILTVFISTRKPAKKAAKISPLEAIRYTEQSTCQKKAARRTNGVKMFRMAFSNLGRNRRRAAFIVISLFLCIVLLNSTIIVTQSLDEEKWINRVTRTDFNVYNSAAFNVMESVQHHEDTLSQQAVDLIAGQPGVEDERYLYRNTKDDRNVLVDYGFEDLSGIELFHEEEGIVNQSYQGYNLYTTSDTERRYFGNVMGASENFWADMRIFEGEKDAEILKQKMATGKYVIVGCPIEKLTEEPNSTPLTDQLQIGESISFYKDGELVKTSTILAKAILVGTETETPTGSTAQAQIAGDAPFVYLPDTVFKEIYDNPTLLTYGFNVDEAVQPQMEELFEQLCEGKFFSCLYFHQAVERAA
nr:ABC transporter permease [uncultured Blautia sp.]